MKSLLTDAVIYPFVLFSKSQQTPVWSSHKALEGFSDLPLWTAVIWKRALCEKVQIPLFVFYGKTKQWNDFKDFLFWGELIL